MQKYFYSDIYLSSDFHKKKAYPNHVKKVIIAHDIVAISKKLHASMHYIVHCIVAAESFLPPLENKLYLFCKSYLMQMISYYLFNICNT